MTRLLLVRHARPGASWEHDLDAGLDGVGVGQARALAQDLGPEGPLPIVTSPMRRTRETAAPLATRWHAVPRVEPAVGEIPSPVDDLEERGAWLREVLGGQWAAQSAELRRWRDSLVGALLGIVEPTVVVSHYVAINAVVGAATNDDRLISFSPGHASVTELAVEGGRLRVVALGEESITTIR